MRKYFVGMQAYQACQIRNLNKQFIKARSESRNGDAVTLCSVAQSVLGSACNNVLTEQFNVGWPLPILQALSRMRAVV